MLYLREGGELSLEQARASKWWQLSGSLNKSLLANWSLWHWHSWPLGLCFLWLPWPLLGMEQTPNFGQTVGCMVKHSKLDQCFQVIWLITNSRLVTLISPLTSIRHYNPIRPIRNLRPISHDLIVQLGCGWLVWKGVKCKLGLAAVHLAHGLSIFGSVGFQYIHLPVASHPSPPSTACTSFRCRAGERINSRCL